jgi:DNA polymerase-3 subunit gamma/tau
MQESSAHYTVLARRFRPQTFDEVIGQQPVAQALKNAIRHGRVAHAYLFTGARGVGKTSMARILAKALNCPYAKEGIPCNECDICQCASEGRDVDVVEIDGASNRRIEDIRMLRSNVGVKPMRAKHKIYIIDEVHMLTTEAFNALLKTLEEPPPNVRFIFCTTEPEKVLDTILSRCQRFDFATIETANIMARLGEIAQAEGYDVAPEALELVARRANGSMRDSQSLFDQLLAFSDGKITAQDVHRLLGTAGDDRLIELATALIARQSATAVKFLDEALAEGVQLNELVDQLLRYLRDLMIVAAGADGVGLASVSADHRGTIESHAKTWGLNTILAALQILSETRTQMKFITYGRVLVELALVRISLLENLEEIQRVIRALTSGNGHLTLPAGVATTEAAAIPKANPAPAEHPVPEKKKENAEQLAPTAESPVEKPASPGKSLEVIPPNLLPQLIESVEDKLKGHIKTLDAIAISGPNHLDLQFSKSYDFSKRICERAENREQLQRILSRILGISVQISINFVSEESQSNPQTTDRNQPTLSAPNPDENPFVSRVMQVFGASLVTIESHIKSAPKPAEVVDGEPSE